MQSILVCLESINGATRFVVSTQTLGYFYSKVHCLTQDTLSSHGAQFSTNSAHVSVLQPLVHLSVWGYKGSRRMGGGGCTARKAGGVGVGWGVWRGSGEVYTERRVAFVGGPAP